MLLIFTMLVLLIQKGSLLYLSILLNERSFKIEFQVLQHIYCIVDLPVFVWQLGRFRDPVGILQFEFRLLTVSCSWFLSLNLKNLLKISGLFEFIVLWVNNIASTVLISPRPNFATLTFKVRHSYIIALASIILIYLKATSFLQTFPFQNLLLRNINFDHRLFNKKQQFTLIFKSSRIRESEAMFRKFHLSNK